MTTRNSYIGNGIQDTFVIGFDYLNLSFIKVTVDGVLRSWPDDYILLLSSSAVIQFNTPPADGAEIVFQRITSTDPVVTFVDPSILTSKDLNAANIQPLHILEERSDTALSWDGEHLDLQGGTIINMGDPVNPTDAVTKQYVDDADNLLRDGVETNAYDIKIINNRIDGITVGGVLISAEDGNAVEVKADGIFVQDLSNTIQEIQGEVQGLQDDRTAQWVTINRHETSIATNINNINGLDVRTTSLEDLIAGGIGGGATGAIYNEASGTYTAPVSGTYRVTIVGGGGSGSSDTAQANYHASGAGGGAGGWQQFWVDMAANDEYTVVIGAGGAVAHAMNSGNRGGTTTFEYDGTTHSVNGGVEGGMWTSLQLGGAGGAGGNAAAQSGGNGQPCFGAQFGASGGNGGAGFMGYGGGGGGGGGHGSVGKGAPGRGGARGQAGSAGSSGAGGQGVVILEYFESR